MQQKHSTLLQKACALLQKHSTLFAEGMRLVAKTHHLVAEGMRRITKVLHLTCRRLCIVVKALHRSCRRHAPCCKSTPLYSQKACALLQKHSTLFAEGMRHVAKALHLICTRQAFCSKSISHYGRRHALYSKSTPLQLQKACALLQQRSTLFAEGIRIVAKAIHFIYRRYATCS